MTNRRGRLSAALYRAVLRLFPGDFRRDFGADAAALFERRAQDLEGRPLARTRFVAGALADALAGALAEWSRTAVDRAGTSTWEVGVQGWTHDLRAAARALGRRPAFALTAGATLALGMAAAIAMFSVVDGVLLRPLPYPDSDRLAVIWKVNQRQDSRSPNVDHPDVRAWNTVDGLHVVGYSSQRPTLSGLGPVRVVEAATVTGHVLGVFGLEPVLGRDLAPTDDVPDGPRVAVVSHAFWQDELGGERDVLGTALTLNGEPWQIVGVAPGGFDFPDGTRIWLPRRHQAEGCGHGCNLMRTVVRLPADAERRALVEQRVARLDQEFAREFPDAHGDVVTELQGMHEHEVADVEDALWMLFAAVGMVLLIACANVANLLLVRASERADETAIRWTLGAGRGRLLRQFLSEALLLTAASGTVAVLLAGSALAILPALAPAELPRLDAVGLDVRAVAVSALLVLAVTAAFGLLPARPPRPGALRSGPRSVGDRRAGRSRSALLTLEVALSLTLLLGAGLMVRSLQAMRSIDLGYDPANVERFRLAVPSSRYDTEATLRLYDELERRLGALPGVAAAGHGFGVPFAAGSINTAVTLLDRPEAGDDLDADVRPSSPAYLDALGLRLVEGRWIEGADRRDRPAVAVLNRAAADAFFPGESPLGRRISLSFSWGFDDEPDRTVVGVVDDIRARTLTEPDPPAVYMPNAQVGTNLAYFHMRRQPAASSVLAAARRVVAEVDPELALTTEETVASAVARASADTRFYLSLLSAFAALALVLAGVGLYGVVAYAVGRRRREIGVRRALGAGRGDVLALVVKQGLGPAATGVALGLGASWFLGRLVRTLLYGVSPQDPWVILVATSTLLAVALVATALPARRATRVAPAEVLRSD
jgi:putative ABC transport system permease protein